MTKRQGPVALRVFMTPAETVRAGMLLTQHCLPVIPKDAGAEFIPEFYTYAPEWDDKRIAKETSPRLAASHVERLRRSMDMKLEAPGWKNTGGKRPTTMKQVTSELTRLNQRIDDVRDTNLRIEKGLDDRMDALLQRITVLENTLGEFIQQFEPTTK